MSVLERARARTTRVEATSSHPLNSRPGLDLRALWASDNDLLTLPDSLAFLGGGALGSLWVDGNPKLAWGAVCDTLTDKGVVVVHDLSLIHI